VSLAKGAQAYFASSGKQDSEWRADLCLARSYSRAGDAANAASFRKKALDTLGEFQHTWSNADQQAFAARPDVRAARLELTALERH
jgi:hypothetical protein